MRRELELGLVGLLALVAIGGAVGQPVLLSYVVTDSMEPALEPGDGFVAVPSVVTDAPDEGDVVVYRAQTGEHAGSLVTHRVVDETRQGYITKGDANPFTDQGAGEPPVPESRIVATALQVDGEVVVLPGIGSVLMAGSDAVSSVTEDTGVPSGSGTGLVVFGIGAVLYAISLGGLGARNRRRERERNREKVITAEQIVLGIALLVVLPATATMVAPAGGHAFPVVSSDTDEAAGTAVPAGSTVEQSVELRNEGLLPVTVFLEPQTEGIEPAQSRYTVDGGGSVDATVRLSAPEETGYYLRTMSEHRYLMVLPPSLIGALYGIHPWLPIVAIDAALAAGAGILSLAVLGRAKIRMRSRSRRTER